MAKKSDAKKKTPSKKGATELTEDQLDDVSGGPHWRTFDSPNSFNVDQLPDGSIRKTKI